jgi:TPR repeat protein
MYWRGESVDEDPATALKWFYRAAEYDIPNAWNNLGLMHLKGVAVEKVLFPL